LAVAQRSVESVIAGQAWSGSESVDLAFRAASALRGLAAGCLSWAPEVSQQCYRHIGVMAQRVQQNPKFPSQNRPALAPWLWDESRGWALAQQSQPAMEALRRALEWGLVDFEEVLEDELLQGLSNHEAIAALIKNTRTNYENRMRAGIGNAIQTFRGFPFRFSCNSLTNARVTESHFQGKWLVVDLWGTWCVPCRAEVPHLKRLHREFASHGWEIVGIAIEQGATEAENRKLVQEFVDQQAIPYACLLGDAELLQQIPQQKSLPTLVFINPQGKVVFAAQGYHDYTQLKVIVETLQKSAPKSRANW
jgi:thiol-disulfide isomerase/thioredoxin